MLWAVPAPPMNGWGIVRWEQRAKDKGLVYTERLYRAFDFEGHRTSPRSGRIEP